jgi:hypothetical protein
MRISGVLAVVVGVGAFAINPGFGCSSAEDEFTYGEEDMRAMALGEWTGTLDTAQGQQTFSLTLEQAQAASTSQGLADGERRLQCANREFIRPAGACVSVSTMPLVGTVRSESGQYDGSVTGSAIAGLTLDSVDVRLSRRDGEPFLDGTLYPGGILKAIFYASDSGSPPAGSFYLTRP